MVSAMATAIRNWTNQDLVVYHGTLDTHVGSILANVDPTVGRLRSDFGQGFYTTTVEGQARSWALMLVRRSRIHPIPRPAIIRFTMSRDVLARLESLWFVRGTQSAID